GVGIPGDKLDAIFEAFQQADGSISRKFGGTGLGLSISRELIRVLGGEIQVESKENIGSVFTIFLPLDKNLTQPGNNPQTEVKPEKKLTDESNLTTENIKSINITDAGQQQMPVFIEDDRESGLKNITLLIIHPDKE